MTLDELLKQLQTAQTELVGTQTKQVEESKLVAEEAQREAITTKKTLLDSITARLLDTSRAQQAINTRTFK